MTNPEIECPECEGLGWDVKPTPGGGTESVVCFHCSYGYRPMTDDAMNDRAEQEDIERDASRL